MSEQWIVRGLYEAMRSGRRRAGETIYAKLKYGFCPASSGWTLAVTFAGAYNTANAACTTDPDDADGFILKIPATTTTAWRGGRYAFSVLATNTALTEVREAERGMIEIAPNPSTQTPAMVMLAALDSLLLGRATDDQRTTSIDGVQLQYMPIERIQEFRERYRQIVETELREMAGHGGVYAVQHHAREEYQMAWPYTVSVNGRP